MFSNHMGIFVTWVLLLQGTHDLYREDSMKLPYWIITFGASYFVFAMCVPHLHGLRWWSSISSALVVIFVAIIFGVSIHDGESPADVILYRQLACLLSLWRTLHLQ